MTHLFSYFSSIHIQLIALTAYVSKMYRAVELTKSDHDLYCFVWRSASSFAANMVVKQNAIHYVQEFPLALEIVHILVIA